jgi:two-component system response regulator GlrR
MERVGIFLLNVAGCEWLSSLRTELQTAAPCRFSVHESVFCPDRALGDETWAEAVASGKPDLLIVCCSQTLLLNTATIASIASNCRVPVVVACENIDATAATQLLDAGVIDVITPPFRGVDLLARFWRIRGQVDSDKALAGRLKEKLGLKRFIGNNPAFLEIIQRIPAIARYDTSVLITGETGTGKEICARALHYLGSRAEKPFVAVNCGAIPLDLVENELFGHEAGAYTGATGTSTGVVREAAGGTLFLDEIDSLPAMAQVKLLRVLQEREIRPLGSKKTWKVDIRVMAASNGNLEESIRSGRFRKDLYYRLNVVPLHLPPLRERREDIPLLARHFEAKYAAGFNRPQREFAPGALQRLMLYEWPGNVRELENVIERAVVLCERSEIGAEDLLLPSAESTSEFASFQTAKARVVADFERTYLSGLLEAHGGNISHAARAAKKNRRAFWELLRKNKLSAPMRPQAIART